jgi:hypothetical protein
MTDNTFFTTIKEYSFYYWNKIQKITKDISSNIVESDKESDQEEISQEEFDQLLFLLVFMID